MRRRAVALVLAATACAQPNHFESPLAVTADRATSAAALVIDPTQQKQRIAGFGASSAWTGGNISSDTADLFFDVERGLGLSLLRMHIAPDGTTTETKTAKLAVARGVKVWAAPWSPPGEWKSTGTDTGGGTLLPEHYQDWADRLTTFVNAQAAAGVPLTALSAQNEPNWSATWESCVYSPGDLTAFVRDYLAPTVARDCPGLKLLTPETIDWNTLSSFANPLLADPGAAAAVDIVAVHDYGGVPFAYTAPADNGKEFWETEVSYDDQTGVFAALETARQIHRHLTTGGVNAFHYWWLVGDDSSGGGLLVNGALVPQAYALGHYSKFVRPGYVRLDVAAQPASAVSTSAFVDPESGRIVIVAVNENTSAIDLTLHFAGTPPVALAPWLTTADVSLAAQAPVAFSDPLAYSLPAQSITTLVTADDVAPSHGEGGQANQPDDNAGMSASGASGAAGEVAIPMGSGGSTTTASGGTSSTRPGHGGSSSTARGGSGGTADTTSQGGANDALDASVDDGGARHVPGKYYACLCRLPGGDRGHGGEALPIIAAVAVLAGRRRSRR